MLQQLHDHGFQTALDLRLLRAGGAEAAELMDELRGGGISIGDRAKVRLLLGNEHRGGDIHLDSDLGGNRVPPV
eukprot:SAG31_NODE_33116_length_347_cov_1.451613_1_plen_73_part_01